MKSYDIFIGIDPGTKTGLALWRPETKELKISTLKIHEAMNAIKVIAETIEKKSVKVRFEDARQRKWFGNAGRDQLQGAGSIKRDCAIWEDFLKDLGVDFEMVAPKNTVTKISKEYFKQLTGYKGVTSEHGRDAALLVYGMK